MASLLKNGGCAHSFAAMSLHLIKRLMLVLAAFAILTGALISPVRAVAAQAGVSMIIAGDDCAAMKMGVPCPVSKAGPCKMAASDCAKMMMCCDSLSGATMHPMASVPSLVGYAPISYEEIPAALRGRTAEPALFPPRAV